MPIINRSSKYRILVVDDNKNIHIDFRKILLPTIDTRSFDKISKELFGEDEETPLARDGNVKYEIDSAYQGKEGIEMIEKAVSENHPYALAFIDMRMPPGWDGLTTIKHAWEIDPDLQIVMCTAYADYSWKDIINRLTNTNNLIILKKPFENIEVKQIALSQTEKWQLIANLKNRAQELKSSQEYLSITLDSIGDAVIATDGDCIITRMNPVAEVLTGWAESEAKQTEFNAVFQLRNKFSGEVIINPVKKVLEDGAIFELPENAMLLSREGNRSHIAGTIAPIKNVEKKIVGIVLGFRDITEHGIIESDRLRLISILESTSDIVATVLTDGTVTYMNKAGKDLLGFDENSVRKLLKDSDYQPAEAAKRIREQALPIVYEKGIWTGESAITGRNQVEIPVSQVIMAHKNSQGDIEYLSTIIRDISARKKAEEEIREFSRTLEVQVVNRTARLEAANFQLKEAKEAADAATIAKSSFLANMSHEIRTPMNGIIAAAELALGELLSPKLLHFLEIIHSSGHSLMGIINDILDFSKIEAGKLDLEYKSFSLDKITDNVAALFVDKVEKKTIELIIDIDPDIPFALIGDPLRIQQILTNLIGNSFKFTRNFGTIILKVCKAIDQKQEDKINLEFSVKDTGVGMTRDQVKKIFHPFTQADSSTTRKFGGTGLGLSISKQLVEMMGGSMSVVSTPNKGTTFFFSIAFELQDAKPSIPDKIPGNFKGLSVFIADDSSESLAVLEKILLSFGMRVAKADSGQNAIAFISDLDDPRGEFDLIFLDKKMQGLGGIEIAEKLRNEFKIDVPLILMGTIGIESGLSDSDKELINGILNKPFQTSALFDVIIGVFGSEDRSVFKTGSNNRVINTRHKAAVKGMNVLVAEDNPTNQDIALAILKSAGIFVKIATNGKHAVKAVNNDSFDVVLMDMQMPEMDGYEATRIIRQNPKFENLPIIAMTAHALKGDKEKCLEAGMNDYITKPIDQKALFESLFKFAPDRVSEKENEAKSKNGELSTGNPTPNIPDQLPGLNVQMSLRMLDLDFWTYQRIIAGFYKNSQILIKDLNDCFTGEKWHAVAETCHSLKGSAANIGAEELKTTVEVLEKVCRKIVLEESDETPDTRLLNELNQSFSELLTSLERLLSISEENQQKANGNGTGSERNLHLILNELATALHQSAPIVIKKRIEELQQHTDVDRLGDMIKNVEEYEYDAALADLITFASQMDIDLN